MFLSPVFQAPPASCLCGTRGRALAQTSVFLFNLKRQERVGVRRKSISEF